MVEVNCWSVVAGNVRQIEDLSPLHRGVRNHARILRFVGQSNPPLYVAVVQQYLRLAVAGRAVRRQWGVCIFGDATQLSSEL